jgi:hypothetical protein
MKVKVGIRDVWDNKDGDVQRSFAKIKDVVGHDVSINPEWYILWAELKQLFSEPGGFVPMIASGVTAWAAALVEIAENDSNEDWTEEMLEQVGGAGWIKVILGVSIVETASIS